MLPAARGAALLVPLLITVLAIPGPGAAQEPTDEPETVAVQGRILEPEGAAVSGVFVRVEPVDDSTRFRIAETDELGYWHLEGLAPGDYRVRAFRIGYATVEVTVELARAAAEIGPGDAGGSGGDDGRFDIPLVMEPRAIEVAGISVEAARSRERARFEASAGATSREIDSRDLRIIPGVIEADPLRAVEILPGVITTSDFSSAYNVRGGSADQNLILLDGVPIFNPTHLGGFFSIFNADMIRRAELSTGGFPAEHGGRVSSVLEIETDPGSGEFHGSGGLSLLATRMALGGGTGAGVNELLGLTRGRWRAAARRSYFDVVLQPVTEFPYHLNDFQGFFEGWTGGGDRITVTAYSGRDVLDLSRLDQEDFPLVIDWNWGNDAVGLQWSSPRRDGGAVRSTLSWTRFDSHLVFPDFDDTSFQSQIGQIQSRLSLESRPRAGLSLSTGVGADRYDYDNLARSGGTEFAEGGGTGWQLQGWFQARWDVRSRWIVEAGLRNDVWVGNPGRTHWVLSPRLSARRFLGDGDWAIHASVGRYAQFLHSIRDEELPIGLDFWVLTGDRTPAVISNQVQLGVEGFAGIGWFGSLEAYARDYDGVTSPNQADDPNRRQDDFLKGTGISYGVDLLLRRSVGTTTGWLSVSWLRAERTFPDPLLGLDPAPEVTYPPVFDRRLDVDLALTHRIADGWELGLRWNLGTGLPYTRPVASYHYFRPRSLFGGSVAWSGDNDGEDDGGFGIVLGPRNGARYPVRHRLDVSVRKSYELSWGTLVPYLSVLNVYNRKNVLFYFYEYDRDPPVRSGLSMFPLLPTLGLDVTF